MAMRIIAIFYCLLICPIDKCMAQTETDYSRLSQDLLYAVRTDVGTKNYQEQLALVDVAILCRQLNSDTARKAFWINIYNAFTQIGLKNDSNLYKHRNRFFASKFIVIAKHKLSLDLIEHGILRRSKSKLSLGYFNKLCKSKFEKKFRVNKLDYRIHFALNCGAKSCPPIAFYTAENIERQLSVATKSYLKNEVMGDTLNNTVSVPAILSWFRRDFGGKRNIIKILQAQTIVRENAHPKIVWKKYDWTLAGNVF
jgi:Protein of unknown function, DUF547